jgi:hypothetical protein
VFNLNFCRRKTLRHASVRLKDFSRQRLSPRREIYKFFAQTIRPPPELKLFFVFRAENISPQTKYFFKTKEITLRSLRLKTSRLLR